MQCILADFNLVTRGERIAIPSVNNAVAAAIISGSGHR